MSIAGKLDKSAVPLCLLLAAVTLAVYWPVGHYEFVNYDDPDYVVENSHVTPGFTRAGIVWAFTRLTGERTYWHPVTWLSHMLDCQLFGLKAGPPHLVNLAFHIANTLLLFLVLRRMTRAVWRSAAVAALFALHPLQVGTVAWVAERKNVLSTFFWLLCLWAYACYAAVQGLKSKVQSPKPGDSHHASRFRFHPSRFTLHAPRLYALSLGFFALGLMSKPALVTVPFVLLLLDYWPLGRFNLPWSRVQGSGSEVRGSTLRLLWEKLPFFAMATASVLITIAGHRRLGLDNTASLPWQWRVGNALVSYVRYLGKTFWPTHFAVFYPYPGVWPPAVVGASAVMLLAVSGWVLWQGRQSPYLVTGWLWFLGVLAPMIGIIQAGSQAMADRFAYVPLIGLLIALCWGVGEFAQRLGRPGWVAPIAACAILGCICATRHELQYWRNSVALFDRAVAVTQDNYIAEENLGVALARTGAMQQARAHLGESLRLQPERASAHFNLGLLLALEGKADQAAAQYREALRLRPRYPKALNNLAWLLATQPDPRLRNGEEALQLARRATDLAEDNDPGMLDTLAAAYAELGQFAEAVKVAEWAAQLAQSAGQNELARQIQARLQGYRSSQPYREP